MGRFREQQAVAIGRWHSSEVSSRFGSLAGWLAGDPAHILCVDREQLGWAD